MSLPSEDRVQQFKRDGYTVFAGLFSEPLMRRWRTRYAELAAAAALPGKPPAAWVANVLEFDPPLFLPLAAHPDLLDFAEQVMGPTVQLDSTAFNVFPNGPKETAVGVVNGWHRDRYSEVPEGTDYIVPNGVNAIVYLQDLTVASGPLRVIPGSHRLPLHFSAEERSRPHKDEVLLHPKAGDVVFTHGAIVHSGTPNTSGGPRYFLSAYYNRSWMRHRDNHAGPRVEALIADARERGDLRLLRLLGIDAKRWDRCNPYFQTGSQESRWAAWAAEDRAELRAPLVLEEPGLEQAA
jgi:hypothetical protein